MAFFCRADEVIIGDVEFFPELLEEGDDFVDVFNRFDAFCFGCTLDFLAVFIRAGQEKDVVAAQTVEPCQRVGNGRAVRVPDVKFGTWIVNRCCNVILSFFRHGIFLLYRQMSRML